MLETQAPSRNILSAGNHPAFGRAAPSASLDLFVLVDWPEIVLKYSLGNFTADLVAILHRVPPVQPGPNSRVVDLPPDVVQILKCSFGLDQLWHRILAGL